jgi:toxin CcdB
MSQFTIYHNTNPSTKKTYPYLMDIQYPLLESLATRLVIPLTTKANFKDKIIKELNPIITIKNVEHILLIQQLAAIHKENLGSIVCECLENHQGIIYGIDFLITGF